MADEIEKMMEVTGKVASNLTDARKQAEGIDASFAKITTYMLGYDAIKNSIEAIAKRSATYQSIQKAMTVTAVEQNVILEKKKGILTEATKLQLEYNNGGKMDAAQRRAALASLTAQNRELHAHEKLADAIRKTHVATYVVIGATITTLGVLIARNREFNQNLIEANSSFANRYRLMHETVVLQAQMGASFSEITESARALVHYGLETEDSFEKNLKLTTQLHQGLAVSVNTAAHLATVVERQLKGSFENVANVVSQLVNDTALAGEEAAHLALVLGSIQSRLGGKNTAAFPEILKLVGRYESALKEVGGIPGAFQEFVSKMATPEGQGAAGALGVTADVVQSAQGVQLVMDRFQKYAQSIVGMTTGAQRMWRLDALAHMFGVTADQANQMLLAMERVNDQQVKDITTQERWREQMNASGRGIDRIANSLRGIAELALLPIVKAGNAVVNTLAEILEGMLQYKPVLYAAAGAFGVAVTAAVAATYNLTRALIQYVLASNAAAAVATRNAAAQVASAAVGGTASGLVGALSGSIANALKSTFQWLMTYTPLKAAASGGALAGFSAVVSSIVTAIEALVTTVGAVLSTISIPLLAIAGVGTVLAGIGYYAYKQWQELRKANEASEAARKVNFQMLQTLEQKRAAALMRATRYGDATDVSKSLTRMLSDVVVANQNLPVEERAESMRRWTAEKQVVSADIIAKSMLGRNMAKSLVERSPQEIDTQKQIVDVAKENAAIARKHLNVGLKRVEQEQDDARREEIREVRDRGWGAAYPYGFNAPTGVR